MGGTAGIGRDVVRQAAHDGHRVRAFGRSAADVAFEDGVEAYGGDARSAADVEGALSGVSLVIQALGVRERPAMVWQQETLFSDATRILVPAMKAAQVSRLLTVTGLGASGSFEALSLPARLGHRALLGRIYDDKSRQESLIQASDLDWTLVQPGLLTNGSLTGRYRVLTDPKDWRLGLISRADVAHFLRTQALRDTYSRQTVVLV